ncbi:serine/threonine protein kinase [Nocardia tengchongensis]|uniref:Serine/threonine protein kinase n=1 Tax=Nocardia tengchongensis TaxID=2055889 RepID=A0ABX8CNF1_9NOCA|nr:serine/threonine-protein kinase [Nocardia tengchongensis]QVI21448.1 serine/threonine protein kinase [Nocardia tengchongensis]
MTEPAPDGTAAFDPLAERAAGTLGELSSTPGLGADLEPGDRIDDFDLLLELGHGAFARVFLARQLSMQRLVAVKVSADHGTEPQTLARLEHEYIVRVYDQRVLPDRGVKLLYMQYLPGGTLAAVLKRVRETAPEQRDGRLLLDSVDAALEEKGEIRTSSARIRDEIAALSWPETVAWLGRRLAEALDYAESQGVLHRDIKPANVLLSADGVPKLADFNISFSDHVAGSSPVSYFGGSLAYMSPEHLEASHPALPGAVGDLDTRSDIYALGVMLWELLTGRRPFPRVDSAESRTAVERLLELRRRPIAQEFLDDLPADCPASLRRVLLTCLSPRRDDRWANGAELAQQFELCLDPRARDLVDAPPHSHRPTGPLWPLPIIATAIGIPTLMAVGYNYYYNRTLIVSKLTPEAQRSFNYVAAVLYPLAILLGTLLILYAARRVVLVPIGLRLGWDYRAETLVRARGDALRLGDRVVRIAFANWLACGVIFPVMLNLIAGGVPHDTYAHFLLSLVVCGAISVAYPYFALTWYVVRCVYPVFLMHGHSDPSDIGHLRRLAARTGIYLAVAAAVPLIGVTGITFLPGVAIESVVWAVRSLCVGGIVGFVLAYLLYGVIEKDLQALERVVAAFDVVRPSESAEALPAR